MTTTITAVKRQTGTRKGQPDYKVFVTITDEQGTIEDKLGGSRSARAQAVIVTRWPDVEGREPRRPGVWGVRGDLAKAQQEATRLATRDHMVSRGRYGMPGYKIPLNKPDWAVAVPVDGTEVVV